MSNIISWHHFLHFCRHGGQSVWTLAAYLPHFVVVAYLLWRAPIPLRAFEFKQGKVCWSAELHRVHGYLIEIETKLHRIIILCIKRSISMPLPLSEPGFLNMLQGRGGAESARWWKMACNGPWGHCLGQKPEKYCSWHLPLSVESLNCLLCCIDWP